MSSHKPIQSDTCHGLGKDTGEARNGPVSSCSGVLSGLPRELESGEADSEARQPGLDPCSPLASCVTLDKMLNLSVPRFPHL